MDFYQNEETNMLRRIVNWIVEIVVVIAIAWFTVNSFGSQVAISGNSMQPALKSDDVVLINRLKYDFTKPSRYEVVAFQRGDSKVNVKRVIGLPGERVQIKEGIVYIDDKPLEVTYGTGEVSVAGLAENPVVLGENEYFLLGDNTDSSEDSRFVNVGNVSGEQILGNIWLRLFPLAELDFID